MQFLSWHFQHWNQVNRNPSAHRWHYDDNLGHNRQLASLQAFESVNSARRSNIKALIMKRITQITMQINIILISFFNYKLLNSIIPSITSAMKILQKKQSFVASNNVFCSEAQEIIKNQYHLHKFYLDTIYNMMINLHDDFVQKKSRFPFKSAQEIHRFGQAIKYYFKYDNLFQSYKNKPSIGYEKKFNIFDHYDIIYKQSQIESLNLKDQHVINLEDVEDNEHMKQQQLMEEDDEEEQRIICSLRRQNNNTYHKKQQYCQNSQQKINIYEDLKDFKREQFEQNKNPEFNISYVKEDIKDQSFQESHQLSNYGERASQFANIYCVGQYVGKNLKRIKRSNMLKLKFEMSNVIMKFSDTGRQAFFDRILYDLVYREKDQELLKS